MAADRSRPPRKPRPLDPARLEELALAYVARFATSGGKLEQYLIRKVRERGWEADRPADPRAIVERFVELGYLDDEAYARAKSGSSVSFPRSFAKRAFSCARKATSSVTSISST